MVCSWPAIESAEMCPHPPQSFQVSRWHQSAASEVGLQSQSNTKATCCVPFFVQGNFVADLAAAHHVVAVNPVAALSFDLTLSIFAACTEDVLQLKLWLVCSASMISVTLDVHRFFYTRLSIIMSWKAF
ncbi:TPA: hypothetical protein ACH3X1_013862 [Trebouxia sp. C0004]